MPNVDELITDVDKGGLKLPEFQRGYVWTRDQVRTYVQSLYRGHPTGHLLIWHAYGPVKVRGDGVEHEGKTQLLLDGQQRLTTLYALIKGKPPPFYDGEELFFDLWFNIATQDFSYFNKSVMAGNPMWFSVHDFLKKGMGRFLEELATADERKELLDHGLSQLTKLERIHSYIYQVDDLKDESLTIDEVVDIFNQVNSAGTTLSRADLAMAHICTFWPEARQEVRQFIKTMAVHGFGIEAAFLIRATSKVSGGSANFDSSFYSELKAHAFQAAWPKVRKAFEYLVNVLQHDAYIDSMNDLSSPIVLVPMLVYIADNGGTFPSDAKRSAFLRWMYLANIWGRYAGQTDTKLRRDIASLSDPDPAARLVEAIISDRGRIQIEAADLEGKGSTSGFYKFTYVLARARGARDWFTGLPLYSKAVGKSNGLHSHHIFPRAVLKQKGVTERAIVNQLANRVFLTQRANLHIAAQEPSKYFPAVQAKVPNALSQQYVPMDEELWKAANHLEFFELRRKSLARAMNTYIASLGPGVESDPGIGITALIDRDESRDLEFKSSLRWDYDKGYTNTELERVACKTVAGFLNSSGGDLIIGVDDTHAVLGLANDYSSSQSIAGRDGFERHLNQILSKEMGEATITTFLAVTFHRVGHQDVCQVHIDPADHPVYIGQTFFLRQGNATRSLESKETLSYVHSHWK